MNGYLEEYGKPDRRGQILKWGLVTVLAIAVLGTIGYFALRDYSSERVVSQFLKKLEAKDYRGAYILWGCTESKPCTSYPFSEFEEDWGPNGVYRNAARAQVVGKKSCESGIIEFVRIQNEPDVLLWVDRPTKTLGFAPWKVREIPPGFKYRLQEWMWDITRNCQPILQP